MVLDHVIKHIRDRDFMSGVERDATRVRMTEECFTPTDICIGVIDKLEEKDSVLFSDPNKTFLDPSCGDGQFLGEVLIRKLERGIEFETALKSIYGVDLMLDNIRLCQDRLICGHEEFRHIVEKNIVCADAQTYDYLFGEPDRFGNGLFEVE